MSSHRDNLKRIFVGNLPPDIRTRDLEKLFYKYGKISFIDLKTRRGPPFAFVEFHDYRDAEDAVKGRDGKDFDGFRLRVEFPRGRERQPRFKNGSTSGSKRSTQPQRRSKFRVKVTGLPLSGSWQDLKDHMREVAEVCFADVYKGGEGVVEFLTYDDMRYAIKKLHNTKFKSHEGESSYIKLREDIPSGESRSRSRSPVANRRRGSPSYSPVAKRRASHSVSRSPSRSPKQRRSGGHHKRPSKRARSGSRSRSPTRSRSASRSPSRSPRSARASSRERSRTRSKSQSRSPDYDKSPAHSDKRRSSSNSRSPSPAADKTTKAETKRSSSIDNNKRNSRSRSRSKSSSRSASATPQDAKRTPSKTPSRTPTPDRNGSPTNA